MQKPIVIARQDFITDVVNLINNSGLPMFVVYDVLRDVQLEVQKQAQVQYNSAKAQYETELSKEQEPKDN